MKSKQNKIGLDFLIIKLSEPSNLSLNF